MKKKIFTLLFALAAMVATAQVTVEWTTAPNFSPNDNASVRVVGIVLPGAETAKYTMTAFSFYEAFGPGHSDCYVLISKAVPVNVNDGWKVAKEDLLGISNENPDPNILFNEGGEGFVNYTFAGDGVELQGGIIYYLVFVNSNEPDYGFYTVGTQRIRLQKDNNPFLYPAGVSLSRVSLNNSSGFRTDLLPAFKASLITDDAFTITWTAKSILDDSVITTGKTFNIGTFIPPTIANFKFSYATNANGISYDITKDISEDIELVLYYSPYEDARVLLNSTNFPDANFRAALAEKFGINEGDEITNEMITATTRLDVSKSYDAEYREKITDLTGIEHFTALKELRCYGNQLTSLDVSKNIALTGLFCDNNQLTTFDISKNTALTSLSCSGNQLAKLDVSMNTMLTDLVCYGNQLTELDVSKNTALSVLSCDGNPLTTLDVSKNAVLTRLDYTAKTIN